MLIQALSPASQICTCYRTQHLPLQHDSFTFAVCFKTVIAHLQYIAYLNSHLQQKVSAHIIAERPAP